MVYRDTVRHPSPSTKSYTDLGRVGDFDMSDEKTTSNVSVMFGVHHNTIRKWVSVLEKRGYAIKYEQRGKFQVVAKNPGASLEQAVTMAMEATVQPNEHEVSAVEVTSVSSEAILSVEARLNIYDEQLQAQLSFNKELVDRLEPS